MVRVGFLSLKVLPAKEKPVNAKKEARLKARREEKAKKKAEKKAEKKAKKKAEKEARKESGEKKKPGPLKPILDMLPAVKTLLGRLRRRLLIKKLIIHYTAAGGDPYNTAFTFGAANAAIGVVVPILERSFRIKQRDFKMAADFNSVQQGIYINAIISMAVWEAVYIVFAILTAGIRLLKSTKVTNDRKDGQKNGKNTDS
jgi:hypothetical protein